jgi:hypothetical protein
VFVIQLNEARADMERRHHGGLLLMSGLT